MRLQFGFACVISSLCLALPVQAQEAAPSAGNTGQPVSIPYTLADALRAVRLPAALALAVGAQSISLPPSVGAPGIGGTVTEAAAAFGQITQTFGGVTAVAPPTATVLNTNPTFSNVYDGLAPVEALKLLAASLDDAQWLALTSKQGLGRGDLSNEAQRTLFSDLLPADPLLVRSLALDRDPDTSPRTVSADRLAARLRLGQTMQIQLPSSGGGGFILINPMPTLPSQPPQYRFEHDQTALPSTLDGVLVRAEVPNIPKESQLDYQSPALHIQVPVAGLKRVSDLVSCIGLQAHLELYADKRLESKSLTLAGTAVTAPASDLLRSLAFCVTGTWRRVGQAYVLTDDIQGVGARRQVLNDFHRDVEAKRQTLLAAAGVQLASTHGSRSLSSFDSSLAFSPSQQEQALHSPWAARYSTSQMISVTFAQMTPSQQDAARRMAELFQKETQDDPNSSVFQPDLDGKFQLHQRPALQILLPSLDGPVTLGEDLTDLLESAAPSPALLFAHARLADAASFKVIPRRAVLAAPQTTKAVDTLVAAMKPLGLNQLWIDVFSHSAASLPGTPFSTAESSDLLAYALKSTKGTGISVFPVVDLLIWGPKRLASVADLDILGRTSVNAIGAADAPVSLFSPAVRADLTALVRVVAAESGIAGLVWRETAPPGYALPARSLIPDANAPPDLGYTETARLAFLRQVHVDPVDITDTSRLNLAESVDTRLRGFDDLAGEERLAAQWRRFRADADAAFLRDLYQTASTSMAASRLPPTGIRPRLFIHQQRGEPSGVNWYGSWDDPKAPLPTAHQSWEDLLPGQPPAPSQDALTQARAQSQVVYLSVLIGDMATASEIAGRLPKPAPGKTWDGVVFDLTATAPGTERLDILKALVDTPHPPAKK